MKKQNKTNKRTVIFKINYLGQWGSGFSWKVIRIIELKEIQTLDNLAESIIYHSFKWLDPHLYSFFLDNKPFSKNRKMEYSCNTEPDMFSWDKPKSSNISIKNLKLKEKQKLLFIFDFGDDHFFEIKVENFGAAMKSKKYPFILEEIGKAPKQYY